MTHSFPARRSSDLLPRVFPQPKGPVMDHVTLSEAEWRARLSPAQYHVLREAGTEPAFAGRHNDNKTDGSYRCAGCGNALFDSAAKYASASGWPSCTRPAAPDRDHGRASVRERAWQNA